MVIYKMQAFKPLLLTIFTLIALIGQSQTFYPPIVNYSTHNYSKKYNPENYCVVQDARGIMYFGNGNGLLEFDGDKWRYIEVKPGAFVRSIGIDTSGIIYAGSYGDFGFLAPDEFGQLEFNSLTSTLNEEDLFFSDIWSVYTTDSKVYFQAQEVVFEYLIESGEITPIYPTDGSSFHTGFLVEDVLHLRSRDIGIVKYENNKLKRLKGTEVFRGLGVFGIHKVEDDSLLIITQEIGVWKWKDNGIRQLEEVNTIPLNELGIFGSTALSDGNFALSTFTHGAQIINSDGKLVKKMDRSMGLRSNDVKFVFEDRSQNVWMALGSGIAKVNYHSPLSYFNEMSGIEGNVEAMIRFKNKMYIGTSYGLFEQSKDPFRTKEFVNTEVLKDQVWDFEIVGEELYVATSKGIFRSNGTSFMKVSESRSNVISYLPEKKLFLSAGPDGIYVYSRSFGLLWQNEVSYSTFLSAELDPKHENIVWLGTAHSGVLRLEYGANGFTLDEYSFFDGLNDDELGRPLMLDGEVKFGTNQGFLSFIHEDIMVQDLHDTLKTDPDYHRGMFQADVLHDSSFVSKILLVEEAQDRTWYCSEDKIGFYNLETKEFVNRPFWGIDFGRVNDFYLEENGILWVGCADGLIRYEENQQKRYEDGFHALIRNFVVGRDSLVFNGAFQADGKLQTLQPSNQIIELQYVNNDVYFSFAAPYFEDEHSPEFSYFLEGHNEDWSNWGPKTEANFTNLQEGDYTFKVRARNIYGVIAEEAHFSFSILPPWYRATWAYFLYGLGLIFMFFIGFKLFSARLKRKNIWLEGVVEERTKEISEKNEVLKEQKREIEDSINYAQRIQNAILPLEEEMKKWVPKSFVLFRPKDIVSGDFYWFSKTDDKLIFICADCTGHGVPGAFMSMIGSDRLNIIVEERKIVNPGLILAELSRAIKRSLKQDGEKESTRDGMDAAICTIDLKTNELRYAGANRPLWVIKNGEIEEIKATKVAVAGFTPDDQIFEEHVIPLTKDLKFYMTSDGYADQFGGVKGKKLKVKTLKELVLRICDQDYEQQRKTLDDSLVDWMGDHEQIDDVCVMGFEPNLGPDNS